MFLLLELYTKTSIRNLTSPSHLWLPLPGPPAPYHQCSAARGLVLQVTWQLNSPGSVVLQCHVGISGEQNRLYFL